MNDPVAQDRARPPFEREVKGGYPFGVLTGEDRLVIRLKKLYDNIKKEHSTPYGLTFKVLTAGVEGFPEEYLPYLPEIDAKDPMIHKKGVQKGDIVLFNRDYQIEGGYLYARVVR